MTQRPYLNLGCGKVILPCERPIHHGLVDAGIYHYPLWHNVDKHALPGIQQTFDLFTYPWPLEANAYDGAILSHIVEHIPHEIKLVDRADTWSAAENLASRNQQLRACQDGWYAFFSELYRVLTPGAIAHILCPYAWSNGAVTDPTHTRLITEHTFNHSMTSTESTAFYYENGGINFAMNQQAAFSITPLFESLRDDNAELKRALQTRINVAYDIYVKLEVVKDT